MSDLRSPTVIAFLWFGKRDFVQTRSLAHTVMSPRQDRAPRGCHRISDATVKDNISTPVSTSWTEAAVSVPGMEATKPMRLDPVRYSPDRRISPGRDLLRPTRANASSTKSIKSKWQSTTASAIAARPHRRNTADPEVHGTGQTLQAFAGKESSASGSVPWRRPSPPPAAPPSAVVTRPSRG